MNVRTLLWSTVLPVLFVASAEAAELRSIRPIASPGSGVLTTGPVLRAVDPALIEAAAREVFSRYNTSDFAAVVASGFYDGERLVDALSTRLSRDARLRVLGVQGSQTLGQQVRGKTLISTVSVVVRAQLEFNDPVAGFQRREGTNELLLQISEPLAR